MDLNSYNKVLFRFFLFSFAIILAFSSCKKDLDEDVLAKINDLEVTEAHFISAFKKYYYKTGQSLSPSQEIKSSILNSEFNTYVLAVHAKETGLADSKESLRQYGMIQRKVYAEEYLEREVLNSLQVHEEEVKELFWRFNTILRASHLYAPDIKSAYKLYERLKGGEEFEVLAEEVFENPYLARNGGDLGEFTADEMDVAFENAAYNLKVGEISEPVKTKQGYSIIKLTDFYSKPIVTEFQYASAKNKFEAFAFNRKKELETRAHIQKVVHELAIDERLIKKLWDDLKKHQPGGLILSEDNRLKITTSVADNELLGSYGAFRFTVEDLKNEGFYSPDKNINRLNTYHRFEEFVKGLAYRSFVIDKFQKKYDVQSKDIVGSIDQTFYEYLAREVTDRLKTNMKLSDEELKAEFYENKPYYDFPMKINLARIVVETKNRGKEVVEKLNEGLSWKQALRDYTIENKDLLVNGELGLQPIQNLGSHAFLLKDLKEGDLAGPFEYQTGKLMVYKVLEIQEPREASFGEVKELVKDVLQQKKMSGQRNELIEKIKKEHNVLLNYEKLNAITINL